MLESILQQLQELEINKNDKLLLAISGGVDSMVLFDLLIKAKQSFSAAHVNFSLRGKESDLDEDLVRTIAQKNNVKAHFKKIHTEAYAKKHKLSIQLAAREIRYNWFKKLQKEHGYCTLVTAHHLDDSIETFFINLDRGTGIDGLTGIKSNNKIFRPLLKFFKEDIHSYAIKHKTLYREDQSNLDTKYQRNWFRHEVLEKWKKYNPNFLNNMNSTIENLRESQKIIRQVLKADLDQLENLFNRKSIPFEVIKNLPHQKTTLFKFFSNKGFTNDQITKLSESINGNKTANTFESKDYSLLVDRTDLIIKKKQGAPNRSNYCQIEENTQSINQPINLSFKKLSVRQASFNNSKTVELFDRNKLKYPLELRIWKDGDKMKPLGMDGAKKISDILIDEKVSLFEKENTWVICSEGKIVWLVGIKTSEAFKIDNHTTEVLQIEWQNP